MNSRTGSLLSVTILVLTTSCAGLEILGPIIAAKIIEKFEVCAVGDVGGPPTINFPQVSQVTPGSVGNLAVEALVDIFKLRFRGSHEAFVNNNVFIPEGSEDNVRITFTDELRAGRYLVEAADVSDNWHPIAEVEFTTEPQGSGPQPCSEGPATQLASGTIANVWFTVE